MTTEPFEPDASDAQLLTRVAAGESEAFGTLFTRHQTLVYRFARQMTGSKEMAEDVTQDVFLALRAGAGRYDAARGSLTTYLYGIARHLVARQHRLRRFRIDVEIDALPEKVPAALVTSTDPMGDLAQAEMLRAVRVAILKLPLRYREALVLCELNGVSYEDAARIAECPIGTIRSRLNRARNMLIKKCRASFAASPEVRGAQRCLTHTTNEG